MMIASVDTLIEQWRNALTSAGQSPTTCRRYIAAIRAFFKWFTDQNNISFTPTKLTPIDLVGYRNALQQTVAARTVNVHLCALRSFCSWMVDCNYLSTNPAQRLKAIGLQTPLAPKSLTVSQVNALLRQAQQTRHAARDYALVQVLVQTGLRISECAALHLGDITISERQGRVIVRAGKGNKYRVVPLNISARHALLDYLSIRWNIAVDWKLFHATWHDHPATTPLWQSQKGNSLSVRAMSDVIEHLVRCCAQRSLVPWGTSAHTLRHTFATNYLKDHPSDLVGLAALLGHSSLETTRIYVQPSVEELTWRIEQSRLNAYG